MSKLFNSIWFKCISFLLALVIVLGGTLAILNDVLYVEDAERTARAIKKIYGTEITDYGTTLDTSLKMENSDEYQKPIEIKEYVSPEEQVAEQKSIGQINKIYTIGTDTLLQATGFNGYKGGTITLWVKVVTSETGSKVIEKIVVESYDKQTLMSKFDASYAEKFYVDVQTVGEDFTVPNSGATYSATAYNNAVKCVIEYFKGEGK